MNGRILALVTDPRIRRGVLRTLAATRSTVVAAPDLATAAAYLRQASYDLLILDHDACPGEHVAAFLAEAYARLSPLTTVGPLADRLADEELARLFSSGMLTHLLAKSEPFDPHELLVSCERVLRGDIFGLEKYLAWGIEPETLLVRGSADREHILERLNRYLDELAIPSRLAGFAQGVADELLMNAVYNAPVDAQGRRLFAGRSRTEKLVLPPGQEALFRYACDGRWLALSVRDSFGSLERDVLFANLGRCLLHGQDQISDKPGGAGMGLFVVLSSVNSFVVSLAPGRATEMIGLLDVTGSYKTFAARPKSFHLFFGEMRPGG